MKRSDIVRQWAEELSARLGRPKATLLARGLSAGDFDQRESVDVRFADGSSAHFKCAFFVVSERRGAAAVFTEHCGYWVIPTDGTEITRSAR